MKNFGFSILDFGLVGFVALFLALSANAFAHPGRLDAEGCHEVHEDYEYESGKVLKKGTRHCHRGFGEIKLDGKELLEDPKDPGQSTRDKRKQETRGYE